jgi:putative ABC transport system ATP-binding protein
MILEVEALHKSFVTASGETLEVVRNVSFSLERGSSCALVGPSGSGKTTLLGLCAGLDSPTSGTVKFEGRSLSALDEDSRAVLRRSKMGFVFQNFQLVPNLTAVENVAVPLELAGIRYSQARDRAIAVLERVGLKARTQHYPAQLSGGEQQRVALARAVIHQPAIIFADEPTGNLDAANSDKVTELLFALNTEFHTSLVLVTHNLELARRTDRVITLKGGEIVS